MAEKPSKIGKYDVIDVLGRGGMGVVYKANDPHLNRLVAIKMMTGGFSDNPDLLKRFYREAQSTGNLQHPNIVTVYDLGDLDGTPYLVMEYLEGETLDAIINSRSQLTLLAKINYVCDVCHGLAYAHHHGIVHRDIKPGNIMVLKNGTVKIVDFGIAHIGDKTVTRTGQLIGSLGYMSPEQINGKAIDTRTDIFSTGVVLYQLLTYVLPFDGDSTAATLLKIIHDPPPPLSKFVTDIPPELEEAILRALTKDREERYRTVEDFGFDLAQIRDRLKEGMVEGHLQEAESLFSRGLTHKAKELLLQVLKIDRQHTGAIRLFRSVQQRIDQEQIGVQIKQFRSQAEEAFANQQFDAALGYVEKALNLHQTDTSLQSMKADIRKAKSKAEELQNLLRQAEDAHQEGDLDAAKKMLEETLELAPNDLQAKALFRVIHREWEERSRRAQVDNLVESARKEIASRRFTAALHVLKEAEVLDPNAPDVKSLIESASAGREQEHHRKELESLNQQIDEALDRDDFVTAGQKIDQGLAKFPEERALLKLKALTEKQRQVTERKQFIDEQLAQARALIQAGRNEEVLTLLEAALQKVGSDPHLQSLQVIVRETVERERAERRKGELLQRAKEGLRRKEFAEAISTLEAASAEFKHDPDLGDLLQFAKEEAAVEKRKAATDAVVEKARALIEQDEYEQAVQLLEAGLPEGHEYEEGLGIALAEARNAAAEYQKRLERALAGSRKLLENRKAAEALKLLEAQPNSFRRNAAYDELLQQARRDSERWQNIENAIEKARRLSQQRNFDEAFRVVEECKSAWGDALELQSAAAEIQEGRSADATEKIELVMADGRMLMMAKEYRAVLNRLKPAAELAKVASPKLRSEFEALQSQAGAALVQQRKSQIEQFLRKGEHLEAADLLRGSQTEFPDNQSLSDLKKRLDEAVARRTEVQGLLHTARRLFSESSWKEGGEACVRAVSLAALDPWLREQAIDTALRAADSALQKDWRSAENILQELVRARAGTTIPSSLRARIAGKKREQESQDAAQEVRRLQSSGNLPGALDLAGKGLAAFPDDPSLKKLQNELQQLQRQNEERARFEQEKLLRIQQVKAISGELERETAPGARIRILEEGLRRYPDEAQLQRQLADLRELTQRLDKSALKAKDLEKSQQYAEAIDLWQEIEKLDPHFSPTKESLDRLRGLQQQQIAARKASLVGQVQNALATYDLEQVSSLLARAKAAFPADPEIVALENARDERVRTRARALEMIAEGQSWFEKKGWDKGAVSIQKAAESGQADAVVRQGAVSALFRGVQSALTVDWRSAERLVDLAGALDPSSAELTKLRAALEGRKREAAVAEHLLAVQKLESTGDLKGALGRLSPALLEYPDEPRLLQRKQALEAQLQAAELAAQTEKLIAAHEKSAQRLRSAGDLQGSLKQLKQSLSEFPGEPRLLRMKSAVENSISEAEEQKRQEQERKRQEEEQRKLQEEKAAREEEKRRRAEAVEKQRLEEQRKLQEEKAAREEEKRRQAEAAAKQREEEQRKLREEKAAREAEKRLRAEAAEKQRLEKAKQRQEEALRKAEEKKLRERESVAKRDLALSQGQPAGQALWKRPAILAIGAVVLVTIWAGVHFLSTKRQQESVSTSVPTLSVAKPAVDPLLTQQRTALDEADKKRLAGDLPGAARVLQDAAAVNGPLTAEIQKMQDAIQAEMKDDGLRKLRQQEAELWHDATSAVDHGQLRAAGKYLNNILTLPEGGIRRDDAQKYIREVIPRRIREEALMTQAKQAAQKNDKNDLTNAAGLLDQAVGLEGPRKSEAEQLRRQVGDKLANLAAQQQQKQQNQQVADLEAGAQHDISQGDLSSARRKVDQIKQAGGDPASLVAAIAQAEKLEQAGQQSENNYQQILQAYQHAVAANDKKSLEAARSSFQSIAQAGGTHAAEARGYLSDLESKLAVLNQTAIPPVAKPDVSSAKPISNDDDDAVRNVIKKYQQSLEQRNADAMQAIWPNLGKKRYDRFKRNFDSASALHVQAQIEFRIEKLQISQDRQHATVDATQMQTNTLPGKAPESRQDKAVFELTKTSGVWVISDVQ